MTAELEKYGIKQELETTYNLTQSRTRKTLDKDEEANALGMILVSMFTSFFIVVMVFAAELIPVSIFVPLSAAAVICSGWSMCTASAFNAIPYGHRVERGFIGNAVNAIKIATFQRVTFAQELHQRVEISSLGIRTTKVQEYRKSTLAEEWLSGMKDHIEQSVIDYKNHEDDHVI